MISLDVQSQDLANIRFAFSPLVELSMSYKNYRSGDLGMLTAWGEETRRALHGIALPYMDAVILPHHYVADFLTPTPTTTETDIERELNRVRETPAAVIRQNVETVTAYDGETPIRCHFLSHPHEAVERLIAELRAYWSVAIAPYWSRIVSVLESDILFRARDLATAGIEALFSGLSPRVSYSASQILLNKANCACFMPSQQPYASPDHNISLAGRGIQLVPAIFGCESLSYQVVPEWTPMLIYAARGAGLWYRAQQPDPEQSLQLLLGSGRARLLTTLQTPGHTAELAQRLNVTSGAVSQHLAKLSEAGLVDSHRNSHKVYYRLSGRGEQLLALFADDTLSAQPALLSLAEAAG